MDITSNYARMGVPTNYIGEKYAAKIRQMSDNGQVIRYELLKM
ncbi:hypothetical protein [Sphingobacterium sp. 1.A.4]|nr:hypothetical protein [Sphingobacterium sp. 1.A.4]